MWGRCCARRKGGGYKEEKRSTLSVLSKTWRDACHRQEGCPLRHEGKALIGSKRICFLFDFLFHEKIIGFELNLSRLLSRGLIGPFA